MLLKFKMHTFIKSDFIGISFVSNEQNLDRKSVSPSFEIIDNRQSCHRDETLNVT